MLLPSWWKQCLTQEGSHVPSPQCNPGQGSCAGPSGKGLYQTERGGVGQGCLLGAVFTSNVPWGFLDGALRDERWILSVTRLQGLFQFLGCRDKGEKKKIKNTRHWLCCDWQPIVTQNAVPLLLLCDFSRHSIMHYFLISQVISSAKQLYKL